MRSAGGAPMTNAERDRCACCGYFRCHVEECRRAYAVGSRFTAFCVRGSHETDDACKRVMHASFREALTYASARTINGDWWRVMLVPTNALEEFGPDAWDYDGPIVAELRADVRS